jgi:uncharacterized protein YgiM (DUF1202 family)
MSIFRVSLQIVLISILLAGCNFPGLSPTPTSEEPPSTRPTMIEAGPPTPGLTQIEPTTITTAPPALVTPTISPCALSATSDIPVYFRPSTESDVFGTLSPGMSVEALARTADGWIGFEPGVAQAANIGIFRLRWVQETSSVSLEGACANLPIVKGPPAGICFTMPMGDVPVYKEANLASGLVSTLTTQQYAAVTGRNPANWYRVDLAIGDTASNQAGWIESSAINLNGPCDDLPVINIPPGQHITPMASNCTLTADADIEVTYTPFHVSNIFGTLGSGMSVQVNARTPNGWLGFEPGVAQAANLDVFRLRWVDPDAPFTLSGSCAGLPTVIGPPPFVCFEMAMGDINVYAETSTSSTVVATLLAEEYAAVTASTPDDWYRIDLGFGNATSNAAGWIQGTAINFNGHCGEVPVVAP